MIFQLSIISSILFCLVGFVSYENKETNFTNIFPVEFMDSNGEGINEIIYPSNPGNPGNYSYQLNMANYFSNLYVNSPKNKKGSCSFVSLAQVLSYYDTFYNDNIILEQYDKCDSLTSLNVNASSPGTRRDDSLTPYSESISIFSFANSHYNDLFDCKLMVDFNTFVNPAGNSNNLLEFTSSIGAHGKYMMIDNYNQYNVFTPVNSENLSSYYFEYWDIVNEASNDEDFYPEDHETLLSLLTTYSDNLIDSVYDIIGEGIPVILGVCSDIYFYYDELNNIKYNFADRHSVVAYERAMIDNKRAIYCNFGWELSDVHRTIDSFGYVYHYIPVEYNGNHYHSNNYIIDNVQYCGCSYHTHNLVYTYVNNKKHSVSCTCGYLQYENHLDPFNFSCCYDPLLPPPGVLN